MAEVDLGGTKVKPLLCNELFTSGLRRSPVHMRTSAPTTPWPSHLIHSSSHEARVLYVCWSLALWQGPIVKPYAVNRLIVFASDYENITGCITSLVQYRIRKYFHTSITFPSFLSSWVTELLVSDSFLILNKFTFVKVKIAFTKTLSYDTLLLFSKYAALLLEIEVKHQLYNPIK